MVISPVTANECANIIKNSSKVAIESIIIADIRELPGIEKLRLKEPRLFITETFFPVSRDFSIFMRDWVKTDTQTIKYKQENPQMKADWAIEISNSWLDLQEESVTLDVIIKIFNTISGKLIAKGWEQNIYKISPMKESAEFQVFDKEFRDAAKILCSQIFGQMGLISTK